MSQGHQSAHTGAQLDTKQMLETKKVKVKEIKGDLKNGGKLLTLMHNWT